MGTLTRRGLLGGAAALAVTPAFAPVFTPALAQASTMTLVVPFPPGGSTDALARMLQAPLQARLNRVVIVENKSGAAGSIGAAQVAKSAPDGSSLLVTFDSHAVIPAILEKPPLDVEHDLLPVFLVGTAPYVIAANADLPYKSFADVIAAAKARPGSVKYASVGIGTLGHLAMTLLCNKAGVDMQHVPYRGGGPAMNDVLGGHVDLIAGSAALITPQLEGGKLRPILQLGRERLPALKDTPTAIEAGFPDFETLAWWGVFAPNGTPAEITGRMAKDIREILSEPQTAAKLRETQMMTLILGDAAEFNAFFTKQLTLWGKVVRDNNIRASG
jgi:tripartite-type tricarboxylate transporter receptor subunit TctC